MAPSNPKSEEKENKPSTGNGLLLEKGDLTDVEKEENKTNDSLSKNGELPNIEEGEAEPNDKLLPNELKLTDVIISQTSLLQPSTSNEALECLESDDEKRLRKRSHSITYSTIFIMSIGFSIVLTGVWPYLQSLDPSASKTFLGWVVAANPLGQMLASPLFGWCGNKFGSNRISIMATIFSFIIGNVLYALLPLFKTNVKYIMMVSRFIVGISSANIAVCRSYISSSTLLAERTTAMSITAAAQSLGFILGPGIQTIMAFAHSSSSNSSTSIASLNFTSTLFDNETIIESYEPLPLINMYTLAAWFVAGLGVLNLFFYLPAFYQEFDSLALKEMKSNARNNEGKIQKMDYVAVFTVLTSFFCFLMVYVLLETIIVPMCLDMYGWTRDFAVKAVGGGLMATGVITLFMFLGAGKLATRFNDRIIYVLLGIIPLTLSMLLFLPTGSTFPLIKYCGEEEGSDCAGIGCPSTQEWCLTTPIIPIPQFLTGCLLTTIGYPVVISLCNAIFSKLIAAGRQGLWMGILTSTGGLSRVVGPLFVTYMYTKEGPFWTFFSLFILLSLVFLLNTVTYKRLVPISFKNRKPTTPSVPEAEEAIT